MEIFQGKIRNYGNDVSSNTSDISKLFCGAPQLNGSVFYESKYCSLNFNDVLSSTLVLATVLFENNWHSILYKFYAKEVHPRKMRSKHVTIAL